MQLTSIQAQDFLSFDNVHLDLAGRRHTFLVGPNGGGKTNFVRALQFARDAVEAIISPSNQPLSRWTQYVRTVIPPRGHTPPPRVHLGVQFTTDREAQLITDFVRLSLYTGFVKAASNPAGIVDTLGWVAEQVTRTVVAPFTEGTLEVAAPVEWGRGLTLSYTFRHDGQAYRLGLSGEGEAQPNQLVRSPSTGNLTHNRQAHERVRSSDAEGFMFRLDDLLPPPHEGTTLAVEGISPASAPPALRGFATEVGVPPDQPIDNRTYSFTWVLARLLRDGLVLTDNIRQPPKRVYSVSDLAHPLPLANGENTPAELLRLSTGPVGERRQFEAIQAAFRSITGAGVAVQMHPDPESAERVLIDARIRVGNAEVPAQMAGAGLWKGLVLATRLGNPSDRVLVLDEPALNAHPSLQDRLAAFVSALPCQFLTITHSPFLLTGLRTQDLADVVRVVGTEHGTAVHHLQTVPSTDEAARWTQLLAMQSEVRALFFAAGVVLLEGDTELGVLPGWFGSSKTSRRAGTPQNLGLAFQVVGSDTAYRAMVRLLDAWQIPWVIVADGSVFNPSRRDQILAQIRNERASPGESSLAGKSFQEVVARCEPAGAFTLATGWEREVECIEAFFTAAVPTAYAEAERRFPSSKVLRGRDLALTASCPPEVDALYAKLLMSLDQRYPGWRRAGGGEPRHSAEPSGVIVGQQ